MGKFHFTLRLGLVPTECQQRQPLSANHREGTRVHIVHGAASYRPYLCYCVRHIRRRLVLLGSPPSAIPVYIYQLVFHFGWLHYLHHSLEPGTRWCSLRWHFHRDLRYISRRRGNSHVAFK